MALHPRSSKDLAGTENELAFDEDLDGVLFELSRAPSKNLIPNSIVFC